MAGLFTYKVRGQLPTQWIRMPTH